MRLDITVPVSRAKFILVHYHIFKNGGTTIEHILERQFHRQFATIHGHEGDAVLDANDLVGFLRQHPWVTAISSHHLRYPKPINRQTVFFDCCFLRHPFRRLQSCYNYFRRSNLNHPHAGWAQSCTARDFLIRLIDEAPHQVSDVQVTQLANAGVFARPANHADLERATALMHDMAVPGLVEMFDESLVAGEYYLRPAFPALGLEYVPQNVSPALTHVEPDSREYWAELWGKDLCERLQRMNEMDLELVHRANAEIRRRLDKIPQVSEKLADFRSRCAGLAAMSGHDSVAKLGLDGREAA